MELDSVINNIYLQSPYIKRVLNKTVFDEMEVGSPVYGEVTSVGTDSIVKQFADFFNEETIFYDLGSGLSKMVMHIGLKYNPKKSIGIEFSKERHNEALRIKEQYCPDQTNIYIINGNIIESNLSDATVIYIDNTVFPESLVKQIYDNIPKGCLILYKNSLSRALKTKEGETPIKINETKLPDLVERTYNQRALYWMIK